LIHGINTAWPWLLWKWHKNRFADSRQNSRVLGLSDADVSYFLFYLDKGENLKYKQKKIPWRLDHFDEDLGLRKLHLNSSQSPIVDWEIIGQTLFDLSCQSFETSNFEVDKYFWLTIIVHLCLNRWFQTPNT